MQKNVLKEITPILTTLFMTALTVVQAIVGSGNSNIGIGLMITGAAMIGAFGWALYQVLKKRNNTNDIDLTNHLIFQKIKFERDFVRNEFTLPNRVKKVLFQDVLINTLIVYNNEVLKFVKIIKKGVIKEPNDLYGRFHATLNDIVIGIGSYYNKPNTNYTDEDKQALLIAVSNFLKWHTKDQKLFLQQVQRVCLDNSTYPQIITKAKVILTLLDSFISTFFYDIQDTLSEMNGNLARLTYRNLTIGN
jgi:hypothetical protein